MSSHLVAVFSDVHFPNYHEGAWWSFRAWHNANRPEQTIALGDIVDLASISRYDPEPEQEVYVANEIKMAAKELNSLAEECGKLTMLPGNHEDRWAKALYGTKAVSLKGTKGLSLREQFYALGLSRGISWVSESATVPGVFLGKRTVLVRHGHRQAGGFGVKNVATGLISKFPTISTIVGHHHRAQLACRTSLDNTVHGIANPHLSGNHGYAGASPDWQRGFTVLEFYGATRLRDCVKFTPHLIIMSADGSFSYGGVIHGGKQ